MDTLHVALPDWSEHTDVYVPLLTHASKHGRVRASVVGRVDVRFLIGLLAKEGADLGRIEFVPEESLESLWMRDYGPVPVRTSEGPGVLDFAYAPDCPFNDSHPTMSRDGAERVWRSPMVVDGGNLLTDGQGACFSTEALHLEAGVEPSVMEQHLSRWAGCETLVWLEALQSSGAPHADMMLTPTPSGTLLLASFDPKEDLVNHRVMTRNRQILSDLGRWTLVDLPAPPPRDEHIVRTWNNVLPFNGVLFVPDFRDVPSERLVVAWNRLEEAFPGRELKAIPSDVLLGLGGAVHCIARAEPSLH
jgi:agmatine deiminase